MIAVLDMLTTRRLGPTPDSMRIEQKAFYVGFQGSKPEVLEQICKYTSRQSVVKQGFQKTKFGQHVAALQNFRYLTQC